MSTAIKQPHQKELFGHPVGLYVLFFTEMWERFSYYGMRAILTLYMVAKTTDSNAGLGWDNGRALALYGWYTMLVYVASIPGGIIADKILGQKKSVMIGGWLLVAGHGILSIEQEWAFYTGLLLIVLGVGMLKPNISTMVGGLYKQGDIRRDKGFSIFYIGINIGAAAASLIVGIVAAEYGWHTGFGLAAIGMVLGQLVYLAGQKYVKHVGNAPSKEIDQKDSVSIGVIFQRMFSTTKTLVVFSLLVIISVVIPQLFMDNEILNYTIFFVFLSLVVGFMITVFDDLDNRIDKDRFVVLLLSFLIVIVFWGAFEQAGGLMNIYTEQKTDRIIAGWVVPAAIMQSFNPIYIIIFGIPVASFWAWWKNRKKESSSIFKMATGVIIMGLGFIFMVGASLQYEELGKSALYWLALAYLFHTLGELCASPVALSFITKLAPVRYGALMMGVYFAATGLGNKVAGIIGEGASEAGELTIFTGITIFCVVFGILVILMLKPLKRLTHGAEDNEHEMLETEKYELADPDINN
ncbi:peptide MFS transporter [Winogradskyella aquimaris]|uniref:Peptide MFS transporter n=1 Tax=Winogradskyella aquimaris TaxID=864074 RepID=A0ABU5ENI7_9FLAO|nr:peptide MFS transporter [Winogradskyella aquimaris]MDY2587295.1 peptide MFS transporter [Winogradskyella aquimaris]